MIYFTSKTCSPCKKLLPKFDALAKGLGVELSVVDIDDEPEIAKAAGVMSVPTIGVCGQTIQPANMSWPSVRNIISDAVAGGPQ